MFPCYGNYFKVEEIYSLSGDSKNRYEKLLAYYVKFHIWSQNIEKQTRLLNVTFKLNLVKLVSNIWNLCCKIRNLAISFDACTSCGQISKPLWMATEQ